MFQMMSSGSLTLYAGEKRRGTTLQSVSAKPLSEVTQTALLGSSAKRLESRIMNGMAALKDAAAAGIFDDGSVMDIYFDSFGNLAMRNYDGVALLPPDDVVLEMIGTPAIENKSAKLDPDGDIVAALDKQLGALSVTAVKK
jgi:hypothetical protein